MSSEPNPNPNPNNTVSHTTESTDPHKIDEEQSDGVVSSDEFTNDVFSASDEPRVEPAEVADESEDREGAFVNSDSDGAGELSGVCSGEVARDLDSSIGAEVSVDTRELNCSVSDEIPIDSAAEVARELVEPIQFSGFVGEGEAVQELTGRRDFEEVAETRELNGALDEAIPCDSVTDVARESVEPRQLSNVDLGIVSGDLGSSIEVEETREVNGAVDEGISGDSATEVARELVESRQLSDVDLGVVSESRERGDLEGEVEEAPLSPNSSGYAGGRGSSGSSIGGSEIDEIRESKSVVGEQGESALDSQRSFEKGHKDEDDASISWRKRKKHFLILSHSGKPIFSRYGDEHKLAGFSATLQAIISFVENGRDRVKLVRAGNHQVVFLVKGPIYLVCISSTEETYESLKGQLELLYGQMILILTKSVNKCFEKNPKFDMTPLLGGTDAVFSSLFQSFNWNPATFLHAYTCVPLAYATRQAVGAILQEVANSGILFSLIMCKHKVVSLAGAQKASLHPDDMLLLANFVVSSESFRTSEAFSPICLPRYNPFAFLHAYVHYFDEDIYLVMLTASSEAFYHLKDCRMRIEAVLLKSNVLAEVHRSMMDGGMRVEDFPVDRLPRSKSLSHLGRREVPSDSLERHRDPAFSLGTAAGLLHFMYRSTYLEQYVSSEFASPINNFQQQKRLYRAYQKLYLSVHQKENGPHKTHFRRDENYVLLCWVTQEFEFYAAFDPLADMAAAIKICNRVCQWVKDVETDIFLSGGGSFSW